MSAARDPGKPLPDQPVASSVFARPQWAGVSWDQPDRVPLTAGSPPSHPTSLVSPEGPLSLPFLHPPKPAPSAKSWTSTGGPVSVSVTKRPPEGHPRGRSSLQSSLPLTLWASLACPAKEG